MPNYYRASRIAATRSREDFWQLHHPTHGRCGGAPALTYRPIPARIANLTVGAVRRLELKRRDGGRSGSVRIEAHCRAKEFSYLTDPRMALRPLINRGEIYLFELQGNGNQAGLALVRVPKGANSITVNAPLKKQPVEIIDYAEEKDWEAHANGRKTISLLGLFPNSAIAEMWGQSFRPYQGGAMISLRQQTLTLGTFKDSPYYNPEGAARVLFCANLATGEVSAGAIVENGEAPCLQDLGTLVVSEEAVSSNSLSVARKSGSDSAVKFETLCEEAALAKPVTNLSARFGGLSLYFGDPPYANMLAEGKLTCRVWLGGIRVDWETSRGTRVFRIPFAPDGTILDGIGQPLKTNGKTLNIRTLPTRGKHYLNFWKLLEGRVPQGLEGKNLRHHFLVSSGLKKLISGQSLEEEYLRQYSRLKLDQDGKAMLPVPGSDDILFTCRLLQDKYKEGGEVLVAFERVKDGMVLAVYDPKTREHLVSLDFDPKEKHFYHRAYRSDTNQRTYIIAVRPHEPFLIFGKPVYPSEEFAKGAEGIAYAYADVELASTGAFNALLRVGKSREDGGCKLGSIFNDNGYPVAFFTGATLSPRFLDSVTGWVPIPKWEVNRFGGLTLRRSTRDHVSRESFQALGIEDGETLWARVESGQIAAVAVRRNGQLCNVEHRRTARDKNGKILRSVSMNFYRADLERASIFTAIPTAEADGNEVVNIGKGRIVIRRLQKNEVFSSRKVALVLDQGKNPTLVHNAPTFEGIVFDIAVALAKASRPENIAALKEAAAMAARGEKDKAVAEFLRSRNSPFLNEAFCRKVPGGWKWLQEQRRQAREREKELRAIYKSFLAATTGHYFHTDTQFFDNIGTLLGSMRAFSELDDHQSIVMARTSSLARLYYFRMARKIAFDLFPSILQIEKEQLHPGVLGALDYFRNKPAVFGGKSRKTGSAVLERAREIENYIV